MELISVIIPVYNTERYLKKCLDSVVGQSYQNLEIILVDDGSSDHSGDICDTYASKDSRITCIHKKNGGVSAARNTGIEASHGDYLHFVDSDDYLENDAYTYLLAVMREYSADAVAFEYFATYENKETVHTMAEYIYGCHNGAALHRLLVREQPFAVTKFFKKELIMGSADDTFPIRFREDILRGEDTLFCHCVLDRANTVLFTNKPLYHYVQSDNSASRGRFRKNQLTALRLYGAYEPLFRDRYPEIWEMFVARMADLLITLYFDMWSDKRRYEKAQKKVWKVFMRHYGQVKEYSALTFKRRVKYRFFSVSPELFCRFHRRLHSL